MGRRFDGMPEKSLHSLHYRKASTRHRYRLYSAPDEVPCALMSLWRSEAMPFTYPLLPMLSRTGMRVLTVAGAAAAIFAMSDPASAQTAPAASATIQPTSTGATNTYALTLTDSAASASPIGTFWFSWIPGEDFMTFLPTNITSPMGWQAVVTGGGPSDGFAIQWTAKPATAAADQAQIGGTLSGFGFSSTDTPASLAGNSHFFPGTPTLTAVAYSGAPFSDPGDQIFVSEIAATPEPASIAALIPAGLLLCRRSRKQ
jgi:hypothetical protein